MRGARVTKPVLGATENEMKLEPLPPRSYPEISPDDAVEKWNVALGLLHPAREMRRATLRGKNPKLAGREIERLRAKKLIHAGT